MLNVVEEEAEEMRRRAVLLKRLNRVLEKADPQVLDVLDSFVSAAEVNEEIRRKRASGDAEALDDDKLTCFVGGRLDEEGPDIRSADREACGERLRRLQRKSKIQAKFWGRELNLLEFLAGDWE